MLREASAVRSLDSSEWHIETLCPDYPWRGGRRDLKDLGPADELCSWCASYGSGSDELDDRAGAVLRMLLRNEELLAAKLRAQRVLWALGDPVFVFWHRDEKVTKRVSRAALMRSDSMTVADAIARGLVSAPAAPHLAVQ